MTEHKYWTHLIKLQVNQTPGAKYWEGKAQVHYNDGEHFDPLRCMGHLKSLPREKKLSSMFSDWPKR
jgi:hypothetical protein